MLDRLAHLVTDHAGRPWASLTAFLVILAWAAVGPLFAFSDTWQLAINTGTTIVTFLVVFLIQNTQNRESAALHAKVDELIRAIAEARNEFIGLDQKPRREIDAQRKPLNDSK